MKHKTIIAFATSVLVSLLMMGNNVSHVETDASVFVESSRLVTHGLQWGTAPDPALCKFVPGPTPDITGLVVPDGAPAVSGVLACEIGETGGFSFWFATDRAYRSGTGQPVVKQTLVEVKDSFKVSFNADPTSVLLTVEWSGSRKEMFEQCIRIILPEFPGPQWHHFALSWDVRAGSINAYLDGTPYYVPGEKKAPLKMRPGRELVLHPGIFALADVRLSREPFTDASLAGMIPEMYCGQMDRLLGSHDLGTLCLDESKLGNVLYKNSLSGEDDVVDWKLEGPGLVSFENGWMEMRSKRPNGPVGHIVHWCPIKFPARIIAEWEFELMDEKGLCILFFAASGKDGIDLFESQLAPRNGVFTQYTNGDINCYHISYFANTPEEPRRVANLRKNKGFHLISNGPVGVFAPRPGEVHKAVLIQDGAHIQMAVDGRTIIDYSDDGQRAGPVYTGGRIGFRQMQWTAARYRNFSVRELKYGQTD